MKNIVFILSFSLLSCATQFEYQSANHKDKKYDKVFLTDIINNPLDYDNKYIEIEGFYYSSMEQSAIVALKDSKKGLWVDLNSNLINNKGEKLLNEDNRIFNYSKKELKIRGKFTEENKGHLGLYKGTVTDIVYFGNTLSKNH